MLRDAIAMVRELSEAEELVEGPNAVIALIELCESAGFKFPNEVSTNDVLRLVETEVLSADLDEAFGAKVKAAFHNVASKFKRKPPPKHHPLNVINNPKKPGKGSSAWKAGRSREIARNM
jgi:hypothetical protein